MGAGTVTATISVFGKRSNRWVFEYTDDKVEDHGAAGSGRNVDKHAVERSDTEAIGLESTENTVSKMRRLSGIRDFAVG